MTQEANNDDDYDQTFFVLSGSPIFILIQIATFLQKQKYIFIKDDNTKNIQNSDRVNVMHSENSDYELGLHDNEMRNKIRHELLKRKLAANPISDHIGGIPEEKSRKKSRTFSNLAEIYLLCW